MLSALDEAVPRALSLEQLAVYPVFEDYQDDPDFLQLIRRFNGS